MFLYGIYATSTGFYKVLRIREGMDLKVVREFMLQATGYRLLCVAKDPTFALGA